MKYPIIGSNPPWKNTRELGIPVIIDGREIVGAPSTDAVGEDIDLGFAGFEGIKPYCLVHLPDIEDMGDLHGKTLSMGGKSYIIENIRPKENTDYARLILQQV